jgi:molecular chaperone GrpE
VNVENNEFKTEEVPVDAPANDPPVPVDQFEQLKTERDGLRELLLRRQAEFDNFRKRTERERSEYLQYAGMEMVKDLIPVLDDFERAVKSDSASPEYAKGVEMIYGRMYEALKKLGLEPMDATGKPFDPHLHQAIERVETSDSPDHTVLGEFQRGYYFKGKLLRPSMVKVSVKP